MRIPDGVAAPKAIFVVSSGFNADGRHLRQAGHYNQFARKHSMAIVATHFVAVPKNQRAHGVSYNEASKGSGRALLEALRQFEEASGLTGFSDLPLVMTGHSAGGQFNHGIACFMPERVMAYCAVKGGYYPMDPAAETGRIPALFIAGETDSPQRITGIAQTAWAIRDTAPNAPIALAIEPDKGHEVGHSFKLIAPFLDAVLTQSLDKEPMHYEAMERIKPSTGVWVDPVTMTIVDPTLMDPAADTNQAHINWLPNTEVAEAYIAFHTRSDGSIFRNQPAFR